MPDPTVVVGQAGGYIHYRLNYDSNTGKVVVEQADHDFDKPDAYNWREIEQHDTTAMAWESIGKKVGWI